jgi:hypothetical protein
MRQRLRPQISVSLLPGIISAAMHNRNSVIAVCTPCTVVSRSLLMLVIATFMFEPAKLAMNCVRASGISICRGDTPDACAGGLSVAPAWPSAMYQTERANGRRLRGRSQGWSPDSGDDASLTARKT